MGCLAVGCAAPPGPGADDAGDTEIDDTDIDTDASSDLRPLCVENLTAPRPVPAADLAEWASFMRASLNPFFGRGRLVALDALPVSGLGATPLEIATTLTERGFHRARVGNMDGALADLDRALELVQDGPVMARRLVRVHLGTVWMRKAELDNCLANGSVEACLVPFSEEALHLQVEGMTNAAAIFQALLEEDDPEAVQQRWLLNVAHMALGTYPEGVPERWRLPAGSLLSEAEAPRWPNVARSMGITGANHAGGASVDDFDGDGLLDVMLSELDPEGQLRLYLNQGNGQLCEASEAAGLTGIGGGLSFSHADYDNDGDLDVFVPRAGWMAELGTYVRPSLLRNDGEGRFTDVAIAAGVADPSTWGASNTGLWGDVDGDGWLDLFVGREVEVETGELITSPSSLYINQRNGTFVDSAFEAGVQDAGYVKGGAFGDLDEDGDLDLFVSLYREPNRLFANRGDGTFVDATEEMGVALPIEAFSSWVFDYDQDGLLDLFVAGYPNLNSQEGPLSPNWGRAAEAFARDVLGVPQGAESAHLYRNTGTVLEDVTVAMGLDDAHATMGSNYGDMDLDGYPDLYLATGAPALDAIEPNVAYRNDRGRGFLDVTTDMHVGHLQKGHGVAFGDLDEDGDEDLFAEIGGVYPNDAFPSALFLNPTERRHAVVLRLEGVQANRSAFGARVRVVTPGRTFHHVVGTGSSFGNNSLQVEVGLDDESVIERVEITWPGEPEPEVVEGVEINAVMWIRQGEGVVRLRPFARIPVDIPDEVDHHGEPAALRP